MTKREDALLFARLMATINGFEFSRTTSKWDEEIIEVPAEKKDGKE